MARYFIGTSGWHYDDWRDRFYPEKLPKAKWLEFYARHFPTVELNNSFYRLPSEDAFANWYKSSPDGFTYPLLATADFAYIRFHGSDSLYSSCYSDEELADWAKGIASLAANLDTVYIYFNNDVEGFAVRNAVTIRDYLEKGRQN